MIDRCRVALVVAAAAYLALLPTGAIAFWRSLAFAASSALMIVVLLGRARERRQSTLPLPDAAIPLTVLAWALWSFASLWWSVDAKLTLEELKPDVLWGVVTMLVFYVATISEPRAFEWLAGVMLASLAFWTALLAGIMLVGLDARPFHRGEGAFATYLVTAAPFVFLLAWRPPIGLRRRNRDWLVAALVLALVIVSARLSQNRIVWVALALAVIVVATSLPRQVKMRNVVAMAALVVAFGLLFGEAASERAAKVRPQDGSVSDAIGDDPRFEIWKHAAQRISERPWLGYGYGLHIIGSEIGAQVGDPKVRHPHNLFLGQWLQTGAIGVALFVAMLAAFAARFLAFVRSRDLALARIGALGLAVLAAYCTRNLTDEFFIRANGKILFAAIAMLLATGVLRSRQLSAVAAPPGQRTISSARPNSD
ncbi:MAG TPA: O-antigen ligase family protein [Casimicrobiaceae bacterium]|nr:O-antigen ligase family protein [Casimicrobiaceae bacterium]